MPVERDAIAAAIQRVLSEDATAASGPDQLAAVVDEESDELTVPNRRGYALGWLAASLIVSERYLDSALDAVPVYHVDHGWDRFLLTRRISCARLTDEASNAFGIIDVASADAPLLTDPDGNVVLPLGELLASDPDAALAELVARFPPIGLVEGDHTACPHTRAPHYPVLYRAVARLVAEYPDVIAGRELHIDDQLIDNAYHPLYLHTARQELGTTYEWLALQSQRTGYAAFTRISGRQSVYRTDRETWASPQQQLSKLSEEAIRDQLRSWLRLPSREDRTAALAP